MTRVSGFPALLAMALLTAWAVPAAPISTASLIEEMTDLAGMSLFPQPAYTCKQFSSYDRKSKSPQEDWFANGDAGQYLRVEDRDGRKEHVMMDAAGPGAIVRIWSANPEGTVRIYLDGAAEPVMATPMSTVLGGTFPGLPKPIAGEYSKGWNLYFPIPYARSCKVTSDKGGFYYHVNYRTYPAGTAVETFQAGLLNTLGPRIQKLAARLANPRGSDADFGGSAQSFELNIPAGGSVRQEFPGPAAFNRAVVRVNAANRDAALRGVVVKIRFDGAACLEVPIGDFFGCSPGLNVFSTLPLGMAANGDMYCHWFMPFRELAVIDLVNHTQQEVTLSGEVGLQDYTWTERSMHFHAKWRAQNQVPTRPMIDWNYLTARGQGVFAGVSFAIDNPVRDWWGEGDEKIYVDGETFPSHFGTGTEDYYGYAWCWPEVFTHAYHAQPRCDGPGNYGHTSVNRFHILDRIPFTKDFRFDMELWHWNERCQVNMAVTAYWYARPGATDQFQPVRPEDAVVHFLEPYTPPKVAGAIEGESLKILEVKGTADPQDWSGLSGEKQLWWHIGVSPGNRLALALPAPKAGKYRVLARFLSARDYGIHQLAINGKNAGGPRDFYQPDVKVTGEVDLGVFDLQAGDGNVFSVTVVGANDKAEKSYMFGLDYLLLKPVE